MRKYLFIGTLVFSALVVSHRVHSEIETTFDVSLRIKERIDQVETSFAHANEFERQGDLDQAYKIDKMMLTSLCEPFYFSKDFELTFKERLDLLDALGNFRERLKIQERYKSRDGLKKLRELEKMIIELIQGTDKKKIVSPSAREENLKEVTCQGDN